MQDSEKSDTDQRLDRPIEGAPIGNKNSIRHGAFSERIPLSEKGQKLVENGISFLASLPNFKTQFIPLLQRIERLWIILLKLDAWEDENASQVEFKHYNYKATYEGQFQRSLGMLFTLTDKKQSKKFARDYAIEISQTEDKTDEHTKTKE